MSEKFVYVTYIRTTPEKLWDALTKPEFTRVYWCETWQDSAWEAGSPWRIMIPDGRVADSGEVVEIDRPRRLVLTWRNEFRPELKAEGYSRARPRRLEVHRCRIRRLAAHPGEPQKPARNRQAAGGDDPLAGR
jgi:uncharacterized protein YndB with AHSA1/START domain